MLLLLGPGRPVRPAPLFAWPPMSTDVGLQIPGYEIQRQLGEGGMATVYLAVRVADNQRVAIKLLSRGKGDEAAEKRFLVEGQTLARLPHANIVKVFDVVHDEANSYIVMECLEGGVLSQRMRTGWLTLADHVGFIVQIAGALQFAHENGVVHRDLKPDNILFRDARTPVLTDFGIARLREDIGERRITEAGMVIGTPTYMSPEQATGQEVDGRSDQYSLGVLFYEMLAGKPPFDGATAMQIAYAHVHSKVPSLPIEFGFAEPLVLRMLAKNPKERYQDLKVFVAELKGALVGSPVLQKRLQIDPNDDVSEKLRAIGFSEGQLQLRSPVRPMIAVGDAPGALKHTLLEGSKLELEEVKERAPPPKVEKGTPWGKIVLGGLAAGAIALVLAAIFLR